MSKPKVCIVHDFLVQYGGAEKTVEVISEIFPDAPIYTAIYKPENFGGVFEDKSVITPGKNANKLLTKIPILSKYLTFLLPLAFENFDLSKYDIILSSSSSYAKGVLSTPRQMHIAYIHTPPRFLYGYSVESTKRNAWYYKPVVRVVDHFLKIWDFIAAQRADFVLTNSKNVQTRIKKFYKRESEVIYPPVEIKFEVRKETKDNLQQPYYVALGRLSAYKNFDLVINAFNLLGINLKIVGTGSEEKKLKAIAKSNIEFLGRISDEEKHDVIENSLGLIFPVEEEDLGIVPIEALAHGKPVLAHRSGGPLETIRENVDGMFFKKMDLETFTDKVREFDSKIHNNEFDPETIKKQARQFSKSRFKKEYKNFVMQKWSEKSNA